MYIKTVKSSKLLYLYTDSKARRRISAYFNSTWQTLEGKKEPLKRTADFPVLF